jgi:hypothetical protein
VRKEAADRCGNGGEAHCGGRADDTETAGADFQQTIEHIYDVRPAARAAGAQGGNGGDTPRGGQD